MLSYIIGGICIAVWLASIPRFHDPMFKSPVEGAVYYAKVAVALVRFIVPGLRLFVAPILILLLTHRALRPSPKGSRR